MNAPLRQAHPFSAAIGEARQGKLPWPGRESMGLGLVLARETVECHGGWITAESTPGQGAEFRVRLPLAR